MNIRNIAIIAHVDHGKTTLVDAMLKQTHTFRENQKEMEQTLLLDSNDLEREKGITILAKNTSVFYRGEKINIIDTPGHADFGSEVERVLNMASGALLLVDAVEGPLPQTRFVLKKALEAKLAIILFINKIDKKEARPVEVKREVENLFLDIANSESALDFKTLYGVGRSGKAYTTLPTTYSSDMLGDLNPLFETIVSEIEDSNRDQDKPFQMLISTLDYDSHVGRLGIGKVTRGVLKQGEKIALVSGGSVLGTFTAAKLYTSMGLQRKEVEAVTAGDIVAVVGIPELTIGQTVTHPQYPDSLPAIEIAEPTIQISIGPNTSPFAGREGTFITSRQIRARLHKELETNLGLRINESEDSKNFIISGRGELHLAILIETMRREGFELEVSKPQVIYKTENGVQYEPFEEVTIDCPKEYTGEIADQIGKRKGKLINMHPIGEVEMRFIYKVSSRNLIGVRSVLLTQTRGMAMVNTFSLGYEPVGSEKITVRNGVIIASETGTTISYGLTNAQDRGVLFYGPGVSVYEGMVVGVRPQEKDLEVNVCREKKLTNNRSSGEGVKAILEPPTILSLEQYLDFIGDDELLEITPKNTRLRKKHLTQTQRKVQQRTN